MVPARARRSCATNGPPQGERVYRRVDSCAGEVEADSNYYYSTRGEADEALPRDRQAARRHPRLRPEPDRPGDRVRLLLRPRRAELPRARLRGGDGQLQPGDGLDRLRHVRPALLRAARRRGGARGLRARAAGGRRDPVRRPDAAQARARDRGGRLHGSSARRSRRSTSPRTASASARLAGRARRPLPGVGDRRRAAARRSRSPSGSATRCSSGPRTCSAAARCASATTRTQVRAAMAGVDGAVLVDRFLEGALEIDVDALCDGVDRPRRRRDGARRGGGRPLRRLVLRPAGAVARRGGVRRGLPRRAPARAGARRRRPAQRPARARRTARSTCSR